MLYLGETKDLGEHSLIEIKTDEDIAIPFGKKEKALSLDIPEELRTKFCFIDSAKINDLCICEYLENGGHFGESIKLNILKLGDYERDITIPAESVVGYIGVIKANTSLDTTPSDIDLCEIEVKVLDKRYNIMKQAKQVNPNGNITYIIDIGLK